MSYREYQTRAGFRRQHDNGHRFSRQPIPYSTPEVLGDAMDELMEKIGGRENYYQWACTLSARTIRNPELYLEAISRKLAELVVGGLSA